MAWIYSQERLEPLISEARDEISSQAGGPLSSLDQVGLDHIASYIDHTLLKLDASREQIRQLCLEAKGQKFATVCVRLNHVSEAVEQLKSTTVGIACVVGFHEGTQATADKVAEAKAAIEAGATELDIVLNRNLLKAGKNADVYHELAALRNGAPEPIRLKLILETSQLDSDEIITASVLAAAARFDFIKTSTGFCGRGATLEDIQLMRRCREYLLSKGIGPVSGDAGNVSKMQIKASGGIRSYSDAVKMIQAGATRLGTSGGMKIVEEEKAMAREGGAIPRSEEDAGAGY